MAQKREGRQPLWMRVMPRVRWGRTWGAVAIALAVSTLTVFTQVGSPFGVFEDASVDFRFRVRESFRRAFGRAPEPTPRVCIVSIDDRVVPESPGGLVPRRHLAELVRRVTVFPSTTVILNVPLDAPGDPEADRLLAEEMARSRKVLIPYVLGTYGRDRYFRTEPLAIFKKAALAVGIGPISTSTGSYTNRVSLFKQGDDEYWVFLPTLTYASMYGMKTNEAAVAIARCHRIGQLTIPADASESIYLNFPGPVGTVPTVRSGTVIDGGVSDDFWRGKVVVIGSYAPSAPDKFDVPVQPLFSPHSSEEMTGTEIVAVAMDDLLSERFLTPLGAAGRDMLVYALALVAAYAFARFRTARGMLALIAILVLFHAGALAMFVGPRVVVPTSAPTVAALISCLFVLGYAVTKAALDRQRAIELGLVKSEYIAYIAHELRAPLTAINGFAHMLLREGDEYDLEQRSEFLTIIKNEADRLQRMINSFTDVARIEAGVALGLDRVEVRLDQLVRQIVRRVAPRTHGHRLVVEVPADLPPLWADRDKLDEVLSNLVDNAIKYSPEGGTITIRAARREDWLRLSVSDEGIGMTPDQKADLFRKFSRVVGSERNIAGTGLGLYLIKGLVEAHGGRIWVESEYGKGTVFYIELPFRTAGTQAAEGYSQ
jgi:signal transduction histidine kinase